MILKRRTKFFNTNAEGKYTKKVRKKTDIGDIAINAASYGLAGSTVGSLLGKTKQGALIGVAIGGGKEAIKAANRKKNNHTGKIPHKPNELRFNQELGPVAARLGIIGATAAGAYRGAGNERQHVAKMINEVLEQKTKRSKKANPETVNKLRQYVAANQNLYGKNLGSEKVVNEALKNNTIKKLIKEKQIKGAIAGGLAFGGITAAGYVHQHKKNKKLREAFEKDKAEAKKKKSRERNKGELE